MSAEEQKTWWVWQLLAEVAGGFSLSGIGAIIAPELIHLLFIIIGGVAGTVTIHFSRKYFIPFLERKFGLKSK